jgi:hypothetical protein
MQLVPIISGGQPLSYNVGMAETFSWIPVANDQGRDLYARASYITNLSDLTVSISAGSFDIGSVHIEDHGNGLYASIADIGLTGLDFGKGAVRVLTQDLDSTLDDIAIGDMDGNRAGVVSQLSALKVYSVNPVSAFNIVDTNITLPISGNITVNNLNTYISALTSIIATTANQIATNTLLNAVTANQATLTKQLTGITILNPTTSVTVANPVTAVSTKQTVTNWDVLSAAVNSSTYTALPSNPANEITLLNNTGGIIYIKNVSKSIGLPIDNNTSFDVKLVGDTSEVAVLASSDNKTVYGTFIAYN